jgi:hypothetical protein
MMSDRTTIPGDGHLRLSARAVRGLRVLEACLMLPANAFGAIAGLASSSGAYKQLARLRLAGLAEVHDEDLGFLFGDSRRGLWSITHHGRRVLGCSGESGGVNARSDRAAERLPKRQLPLRVTAYWLLAWFLVEAREHGDTLLIQGWECPSVAQFQLAGEEARMRVRVPAAAYIACEDSPSPPSTRLLLLPDLGTAPVARYREMLRRVVIHVYDEQAKGKPRDFDKLLVGTPDPDGRGIRAAAWCALLTRVARREGVEPPDARVVSWSEVDARLGGSALRALTGGRWERTPSTPVGRSGREQVLHLLGRHPLLTAGQLAILLGTRSARVERLECELIELGWLRAVDVSDLSASRLDPERLNFARLVLVDVTRAGRLPLADMLGLDPPTASRYHGLTDPGRASTDRRRRFLRIFAAYPGYE